jgi:putative hydrolase of the HAD superfamily
MGVYSRIPSQVRAIFFDAVGTLIHPEPSPGAAYAQIGQRFGSRLDPAEIRQRFPRAFQQQEDEDARTGYRTDEARELQRWQRIVTAVLDDVSDRDGCFAALYEHFARPQAWRVEAGAARVVSTLLQSGYVVGMASNFDHRLRDVIAGLPELAGVQPLVISSEIGWKKPAVGFFEALVQQMRLPAEQILIIGDDADNDLAGARAAGMPALLFDPAGLYADRVPDRLTSLEELLVAEAR